MRSIIAAARATTVALSLLAGAAHAQEGVTKSTIVLGQSLALTGPASALAAPFHRGAKLYFDRLNKAGGVQGRTIELVTLDDAGDPAVAAANTRKLLDRGVLSLFGFYGSPQVAAAYAGIKDGDVLMFAPMAAGDEFRGALYPNIYSLRPGYSEEAAAITRHAETLGARRLAIVHGDDSESLAALDAAERTMTSLGANLVAKAMVAKAQIGAAVKQALAARPESTLVIGHAGDAAGVVRGLREQGFRGPIYGFSNTGESLLAEQLGPSGAGVVVVRVVPKSDSPKVPVVRELIADAQAVGLGKPNVYMLEGYLAAQVFTEALRRAGKEPTRARLRKAIEELEDLSLGGFRVHFAHERVGSRLVELSLIDSQGRVRE